jgi:hypothetical protein
MLAVNAHMDFPTLKPGQVAVVQAERSTGIVLTPAGGRHLGAGAPFLAFESLAAARAYAKGVVAAKPEVECGLYDCAGTHLERIVSTR